MDGAVNLTRAEGNERPSRRRCGRVDVDTSYRRLRSRNLHHGSTAYVVAMDHLSMRACADFQGAATQLSRYVGLQPTTRCITPERRLNAMARRTCLLSCDIHQTVAAGDWLGWVPYMAVPDLRDRMQHIASRWRHASDTTRGQLRRLWHDVFEWSLVEESARIAVFGCAWLAAGQWPPAVSSTGAQRATLRRLLDPNALPCPLLFQGYGSLLDLCDSALRRLE